MLLYVGAGAFALASATLVLMLLSGRAEPSGVARSLTLIQGARTDQALTGNDLPFADRLVRPFFASMHNLALRLSPAGATQRMSRLLDLAGNPPAWTTERIMSLKGAALLAAGAAGLAYGGGPTLKGIALGAVGAAVGFFLPDLLLYNKGVKRQEELRRGLADALDMLTVCVEAGQGFDSAMSQVARSVTGPVAGEFTRVLKEIQIGKSRGEAFAALGKRTKVPEIKTFVSALVQADRLGLPVGNVLRQQADQMRLIRRQRAEEKAQKVPVKILIPMLLCIFPSLFIVIIGPGAIRMIATFSHMGG